MFRCFRCNEVSKSREKGMLVVLSTRIKDYPERSYYAQGRHQHDPGGVGLETVKEVMMHTQCAAEFTYNGRRL